MALYLGTERVKLRSLSALPYSVVGNVSITDGVASGFTDNNYFYFSNRLNTPFEFKIKLKLTTEPTVGEMYGFLGHSNMYGIMSIGVRNWTGDMRKVDVNLSTNSSSWNIADQQGTVALNLNEWFYCKLTFNGTQYKSEISTDDVTYTQNTLANSSRYINNGNQLRICLGKGRQSGWSFSVGQIDFNESTFQKNGIIYKFAVS